MKTVYIWTIGVLVLACRKVGAAVRQRLYVQTLDTAHGSDIPSVYSRSSLDCARLCSDIPLCRRYSYNTNDKKCWMSTDKLLQETTGGAVYMRECPAAKGFTVHQLGSRSCCLKDYTTKGNYATALDKCASEDAHLFLLESIDDLNYLIDEGGMSTAWIDGGADKMTWYGSPLPWTPWLSSPTSGECVFGAPPMGGIQTAPCAGSDNYVCQIDV